MFKKITRGGQVNLHNISMFVQVFRKSILFGFFFVFLTSFFWQLKENVPLKVLRNVKDVAAAHFKVEAFGKETTLNFFGRKVKAKDIIRRNRHDVKYLEQIMKESALMSLFYWLVASCLVFLFWYIKSLRLEKKELLRGGDLVSFEKFFDVLQDVEWKKLSFTEKLKTLINGDDLYSHLTIGDVPIVKGSETSHILLTGTTGVGKTNALNGLISSIGEGKLVIVDTTGGYVENFYRSGKDILLNPFDARSLGWNPWSECEMPYHYDAVAEALIQSSNVNDKFWDEGAKNIVSAALQKLEEIDEKSISSLREVLFDFSEQEYEEFFSDTIASTYTKKSGEKMTTSFKSIITNNMRFLRNLSDSESSFSMRKWIMDDNITDQRVFINCTPDSRVTLRNYLTTLFDIAVSSTMSLQPSRTRRIWFICDELPSLGKVPSLEQGLAEIRKYGGAITIGIQSIPQLSKAYGREGAKNITNLLNTKVIFRSTDSETNQYLSQILGENEIKEKSENISFGANTMRDGVNLSTQKRREQLVLPSEISELKNLNAYLKFPGVPVITSVEMDYLAVKPISISFLAKKADNNVVSLESKKEKVEKKKSKPLI